MQETTATKEEIHAPQVTTVPSTLNMQLNILARQATSIRFRALRV